MLIIGFCTKNYIIRHVFRLFWALFIEKLQKKSILVWSKIETLGPKHNLQNFKNYSSKWPVIGTEQYTVCPWCLLTLKKFNKHWNQSSKPYQILQLALTNSIFLYHIICFLLIAKIADFDKIAILSANLALFSKSR